MNNEYTEDEQKRIFAKNLNKFIYETGKQQKEVAQELGMSATTLNTWCKGKILPNPSKIKKLCNYFNCYMTDLVDKNPDISNVTKLARLSSCSTTVLDYYLKLSELPEEQQQIIFKLIDTLKKPQDSE